MVFNVIDLLPTAPSDQVTVTVRVFILATELSMAKVRVKEAPLIETVAFPLKQLFDPPVGVAPALA
jgi:hypothetical protein